ncbi:CRISPR-associated Cas2 family protein [Candidatus Scalindua japonica]|uniref:CRISPR-associated endoribonuclease Cas2 n=1 Tax=Candidatus Scalindua japonica TaxID=1284222 RepID=A0A286TU54_9BACT|nr:CRISPR-associated endonuclease Cas2 [Candidatus Scalindua japonica]GAX59417.1 CRISPR-associated Cas2 family protein [Candidatus Scalindua japonica]
MFVILYYDVNSKRCGKMLKTCRKHLQWVQNSVFEGEMSDAGYEKMILELRKIIKVDSEDSIVVYKFRHMKYYDRCVYGTDKKEDIKFI